MQAARHALGNALADIAGKNARQGDLPLVCPLLGEINERRKIYKDMLHGFLSFQQACARAVTQERTQADPNADVGGATHNDQLEQLCEWKALTPTTLQQLAFPALQNDWLTAAPWPPWFLACLWSWSTRLQLPAESHVPKEVAGVSFFGLLADFVLTTGTAPPLASSTSSQAAVPTSHHHGGGPQVPRTRGQDRLDVGNAPSTRSLRACIWLPCLSSRLCPPAEACQPRVCHEATGHRQPGSVDTCRTTARLDGPYGLQSQHHQHWASLTEHRRVRMRKQLWSRRPAP